MLSRLPNGYGSISKLSGTRTKPYVVRKSYTKNGKKQSLVLGYFSTYIEAFEYLVLFNRSGTKPYSLLLFSDVFEEWLTYRKSLVTRGRSLSNDTIMSYKYGYLHLKKLHNMKMGEISFELIQQIFDEDTSGIESHNKMQIVVRQVFEYAMKKGYIREMTIPKINIRVAPSKLTKTIFTVDEVRRLWEHENDLATDIILILLYTGMRVSELLEMNKSDIHIEQRYMIGGKKTESGRNRIIPIHREIEGLLKKIMAAYDSEVLYPYTYSNFYDNFWKIIKKENGFTHTIHETRHTFVSRSQSPDIQMDLLTVKKIVGHKANDITGDVYTHKDPQDLIREIDKFYYLEKGKK